MTADITVSGGTVTTVTVNNTATLENYGIGDVLSAADSDLGGGGGSGLEITVGGDGDGQVVILSAGIYQEVAPIQIKRRNVSIIGQSLRSCIVHPTPTTQTNTCLKLTAVHLFKTLPLPVKLVQVMVILLIPAACFTRLERCFLFWSTYS